MRDRYLWNISPPLFFSLSNQTICDHTHTMFTQLRTYSTSKPLTILRLGPTRFAQDAWTKLTANYPNIEIVETSATNRSEFIKELKSGKFSNVDYLTRTFESVTQTGMVDSELLKLFKENSKLKVISHNGAGYDQIDPESCKDLQIQLSNVPNLVNNATADTAVYLMLSTLRNFNTSTENLKRGLWKDYKCAQTPIGNDPEGKVLGILGMGGIGRSIRDRIEGFGFSKVLYYNRNRLNKELEKDAVYCPTMQELFEKADILSISIPLNEKTKHLVNKETIGQMKDGVIIINTARGPIIKEADLKDALKSGKVKAFGTDVFENEPNVDMELVNSPNVVALPHMGTHTMETMKLMEEYVVKNVDAYAKSGKVLSMVSELKDVKF